MKTRAPLLLLILVVLALLSTAIASAQVATLRTPDPDGETSEAPLEAVDGEEAILDFVACLRDHDLDIPDPQFGPDGPRIDPAVLLRIDFRSPEFLDAMEACQDLLAALMPEVDPELQAEQVEQQLAFGKRFGSGKLPGTPDDCGRIHNVCPGRTVFRHQHAVCEPVWPGNRVKCR